MAVIDRRLGGLELQKSSAHFLVLMSPPVLKGTPSYPNC